MTVGPEYGGQQPAYGDPRVPSYGGYGGYAYQAAAYGRAQVRAADADRERAVSFLKTAFTEGRLDKDDYDARVGRALTAKTYADLDALTADLNVPRLAMPTVPKTNSLAVASLVCGIGQLMVGPLSTIPAIVLGHVARQQIRRTGENGAGMALAGLLLGWGAVVLGLLLVLGIVLLAVAVAHGHPMPALTAHPPG
jgi:DUF1707 SHOCT-like domain/Domain of unknown function (DUF4190)